MGLSSVSGTADITPRATSTTVRRTEAGSGATVLVVPGASVCRQPTTTRTRARFCRRA